MRPFFVKKGKGKKNKGEKDNNYYHYARRKKRLTKEQMRKTSKPFPLPLLPSPSQSDLLFLL